MLKLILFTFFAITHLAVFAQDKIELEKKKKQTQQEIEMLNRQYNEVKKSKKESIGQLTLIQNKITLRNEVISNINKQVNVIDGSINKSYNEMRRLQKDLDTLKMNYARNVVYAYKNRSNYDFLNFLFSATSFNDAIKRIAYMKAYRSYRAQQLEAIHQTEALYKQKIVQLTNNKKEKTLTIEDQAKEMNELVKDKQEQAAVVNKLKLKEKEISNTIAAKKKQAKSFDATIRTVIAREIKLARDEADRKAKAEAARIKAAAEAERKKNLEASNNKTNTTITAEIKPEVVVKKEPEKPKEPKSVFDFNKEDMALGVRFEDNRNKFPWPVDNGYVSTPYGKGTMPGTKIQWEQNWITIGTTVGTSVKCIFDGEVVSVFSIGSNEGVTIKHGKYFTTYSNLSSIAVSKGQNVKSGQVIGKVAANIDGEGEIEFSMMKELNYLNPTSWLRSR